MTTLKEARDIAVKAALDAQKIMVDAGEAVSEEQIKAVEDAAWKQSDPEADARKSSFEEQLNAQLAELDAKIAVESDPKKKAKLESEKATKEQWLNAIK